MNRRNAMLVAGAVGLAAVAAVGVQYPNYKRAKRDAELMRNENRVESLISREIARGDGTRVDLDKLVDLPWNRVYVLAPYTTFESARREMPGAWCLRDHAGIDLRDDICILAFYEGSKLVARIPELSGTSRVQFAKVGTREARRGFVSRADGPCTMLANRALRRTALAPPLNA